MKAIQVRKCGGPEALEEVEIPEPKIGSTEVLVELEAIGINFIDTYHRKGLYKKDLPFIPGIEGVGRVVQSSAEDSSISPGQRVAFCDASSCYAERVAVEVDRVVPVPAEISPSEACALMVQGMTAHYLATSTYALKPGARCLVHAGAGGLGLLLTQIAKLKGAYVYTTVSSSQKAALSKDAGADTCINYLEQDFAEVITEDLKGEGLDVVYDSVGETTFEGSLKCLRPRGMMVSFGNASGPVPEIAPLVLAQHGSLFLTRPKLFDYVATAEELRGRADELFELHSKGRLKVSIGAKYPLLEAERAHRELESRSTTGKLILEP